jgi:hypothetical protein
MLIVYGDIIRVRINDLSFGDKEMYLCCASVCYRGYAQDEVSAMLEHAPKVGFKFVDIHGHMRSIILALVYALIPGIFILRKWIL